jgi:hypothetical protein
MRVRPSMDQIVGLIEHDPFKIIDPEQRCAIHYQLYHMLSTKDKGGIDLEEQV